MKKNNAKKNNVQFLELQYDTNNITTNNDSNSNTNCVPFLITKVLIILNGTCTATDIGRQFRGVAHFLVQSAATFHNFFKH
jgi:hypothetical protein